MLTSRPAVEAELPELLSKLGIKVKVTEDRSVDPPMLLIVQEEVWPYPEEVLLFKRLGDGISLYDVMQVIDRLGFPVEHEELK